MLAIWLRYNGPDTSLSFEIMIDVLLIVVIGGMGTVYGALIGALIMASLDNGMSMLGVDTFWQMIVKGSILLLAVWVDVVSGAGSDR